VLIGRLPDSAGSAKEEKRERMEGVFDRLDLMRGDSVEDVPVRLSNKCCGVLGKLLWKRNLLPCLRICCTNARPSTFIMA